jgi:flagellar hook-associated protein 2
MASAITASGLGSNLDVEGMVTKLMDVEKQPIKLLDKKEASYQAQISAYGSLKSILSSLQTAVAGLVLDEGSNAIDFYSTYSGKVSDEAIAKVTAGSGSSPGKYSLEVSSLAQAHRLVSSPGLNIGTGKLTISLGEEDGSSTSRSTTIDITDNSLESIKDAINSANAGVSAAIIKGENGPQLILTGSDTGSRQFISLSGVDGLSYTPGSSSPNFTQDQAASNAKVKLNGIAAESQSNRLDGVLTGVVIDLEKVTAADSPITLTLTRDTSSLTKALEKMVSAYNDFVKQGKDLSNFDPSPGKSGILLGDAALRSSNSRLRSAFGASIPGLEDSPFKNLSDIGISFQKDGTLALDSKKLEKAIQTDFAAVANVASGVGKSIENATKSLVGAGGVVLNKKASIEGMVKTLNNNRASLESKLTMIEARYRKQFTSLDALISNMLQTSNSLAQQLSSLDSSSNR